MPSNPPAIVPYHCRYLEPVGALPGVGPKVAALLERKDIRTVADLLYALPIRYDDRRIITPIAALSIGQTANVRGVITQLRDLGGRGRPRRTVAELTDETGKVAIVWFGFAGQRFAKGDRVQLSGAVVSYENKPQLQNPDGETFTVEPPRATIIPIYGELEGIGQRTWRKLYAAALERFASDWIGGIPETVRRQEELPTVGEALQTLHGPSGDLEGDPLSLCETAAPPLRALIFEDWYIFQLAMLLRRRLFANASGIAFAPDPAAMQSLLASLPFALTNDQERAWNEIVADMKSERPMHRLIHGEVGAGKTILAVLAAFLAARNGCQVAVLAPTEILAEQHQQRFAAILEPLGITCTLVTGAETPQKSRRIKDGLRVGVTRVAIGTHALLGGDIEFQRLGLVIIDEQHKFGVAQRAALVGKGVNPDVLVLSATPIPRSLALTLCGDLDISVLRERPGGEGKVVTRLAPRVERAGIYREVAAYLRQGRRAYIVSPRLAASAEGQSDTLGLYAELRSGLLSEFRLDVLHGKTAPDARRRIITALSDGDLDAVVATTVIEVGLDIPGAGVLVVENAERFGLSQLHQMRGRIGRDGADAVCFLLYEETGSEKSLERLRMLAFENDGFAIAEADLRLRGPGELMGARQSGLPSLRFAKCLSRELSLLETAHQAAAETLAGDPTLSAPAHHWAKMTTLQRWGAWLGQGGYG